MWMPSSVFKPCPIPRGSVPHHGLPGGEERLLWCGQCARFADAGLLEARPGVGAPGGGRTPFGLPDASEEDAGRAGPDGHGLGRGWSRLGRRPCLGGRWRDGLRLGELRGLAGMRASLRNMRVKASSLANSGEDLLDEHGSGDARGPQQPCAPRLRHAPPGRAGRPARTVQSTRELGRGTQGTPRTRRPTRAVSGGPRVSTPARPARYSRSKRFSTAAKPSTFQKR